MRNTPILCGQLTDSHLSWSLNRAPFEVCPAANLHRLDHVPEPPTGAQDLVEVYYIGQELLTIQNAPTGRSLASPIIISFNSTC